MEPSATADFSLTLTSSDLQICEVEVSLGFKLLLKPRKASLFSQDFLDGYVFWLCCPSCGEAPTNYRGNMYDFVESYTCKFCKTAYPWQNFSLWWASEAMIEALQGLVRTRQERAPWDRGFPAEQIIASLGAYDGFGALEKWTSPALMPLMQRFVTVKLATTLDEVYLAWKKARRKRKPLLRENEFKEFVNTFSTDF